MAATGIAARRKGGRGLKGISGRAARAARAAHGPLLHKHVEPFAGDEIPIHCSVFSAHFVHEVCPCKSW